MARASLPTSITNAKRMRAMAKVIIGGQDVTQKLAPYLIQLTITKQRTGGIGEANIELDDRYGQLKLPTSEDQVDIQLGWPEEASFRVFRGKPADVMSRGQRRRGRTVTIKVTETSLLAQGKGSVTGDWGDGINGNKPAKLGTVLEEAAKSAGYSAQIDDKLKDVEVPYISANGEGFLSFMKRLGKELNFFPRATGDVVEFVHNDTAANTEATINAVVGRNVLAWGIRPKITRTAWKSVGRIHFDPVKAKWMEEKKDIQQAEGMFPDVTATWRDAFPGASKEEAELRNSSDASDMIQNRGDGWVMIDGEPRAEPGATMTLKGARDGVDGNYTIDEVEHSYSRQNGFTTRLQVIKPQGVSKVDDSWKKD